ncbi:hypothetical protein D9758_010643 [Tetrapyrgos nigripes]|uniref:Uncharacterized protein n=1 Tax=Tetrapyrgos nigripes TaxID=182062 RepID=A0A8H5GGR8_9AGAR|nr:hypothetical protein D9758_010643 [Tetrapyrgos nigripes]
MTQLSSLQLYTSQFATVKQPLADSRNRLIPFTFYSSPSSFLAHKLADTRPLDSIITSSSLQSAGVPAATHTSRFLVQKYGWYGCGIDARAGSSRAGPWKLQLCGLRRLRAREEHGIIDVAEEVKRYASARTPKPIDKRQSTTYEEDKSLRAFPIPNVLAHSILIHPGRVTSEFFLTPTWTMVLSKAALRTRVSLQMWSKPAHTFLFVTVWFGPTNKIHYTVLKPISTNNELVSGAFDNAKSDSEASESFNSNAGRGCSSCRTTHHIINLDCKISAKPLSKDPAKSWPFWTSAPLPGFLYTYNFD